MSLDRVVAVKMILAGELASEEDIQRFHTEAEAAANLRHPNIVAIYEVGEHEGQHYFSMDFVEGENLAEMVRDGPLPSAKAAESMRDVASAVQYAHQRRILHRDLKPSNVLVDVRGRPRVTDFGLAKRVEGDSQLTVSGAAVGTPGYMSPEQAEGKHAEVGPASDIYSLGAILYELLTGRAPFSGDTPFDTIAQVLEGEPVPPRRLNPRASRDLETICLKCMARDPQQRYGSAQALADDLDRYLLGEPILARPLGLIGRSWKWARHRPTLAVTLAALMLLYAMHLVCLWVIRVPGVGGAFHWFVTALVLAWALGACTLQRLVLRPGWSSAAMYGHATMNTLMFTLFLLAAKGPSSPLLIGYLILVAATGLRGRVGLVWSVTGLCMSSYLVLVIDAQLYRPEHASPPYAVMYFLIGLAIMGLIVHLMLRRVRAAASAEGSKV